MRLTPGLLLTAGLLVPALALLLSIPTMGLAQGPGTEGSQWTYLGGDAWHTRYTPSDQLDPTNFEQLEIAWDACHYSCP